MTEDEKAADHLDRLTWTPIGELPGAPTFDQPDPGAGRTLEHRFDYGDLAQQAEMDGVAPEEPLEMVDAPVQAHRHPAYVQREKKRNQRPLPT